MRNTCKVGEGAPVRIGVFARRSSADAAVARLHAAGFARDQITVVCSTCTRQEFDDFVVRPPSGKSAPKAATIGAFVGALLGGGASVAIATSGGVSAPPVAALIALGVVGGCAAGAYIGAMMSRGTETEATEHFDRTVQPGRTLVSVETIEPHRGEQLADAERILRESGAEPLPLNKQ